MAFKTKFHTDGSAPVNPPRSEFPNGEDVDGSNGARKTCTAQLPYPAPSRGVHICECEDCGLRVGVTAAGRPDDPRSMKVACLHIPGEPVVCLWDKCTAPGRWQVAMRMWPVDWPVDQREGHGNFGLTTLVVCDECKAKLTFDLIMDNASKRRLEEAHRNHGLRLPDWSSARLEFVELLKGGPVPLDPTMAQGLSQQRPPGKAN